MQLIKETFLALAPVTKLVRTPISGSSGLYLEQNKTGYTFQLKYKSPETSKYRFTKLARFKYGDNINKKMLDNVLKQYVINQGIVAQGIDPLLQKKIIREENQTSKLQKTVNQCFDAFIESNYFSLLAKATQKKYLDTYRLHIASYWGRKNVALLKRSEVKSYLDKIKHDGVYNNMIIVFNRVQRQAVDFEVIEAPFIYDIDLRPTGTKSDTLEENEISKLILSSDGWDGLRNIAKMELLTGCRVSEISGLRWDEIDLKEKTITIPPERIKTEKAYKKMYRPHIIPLLPKMSEVLLQQRQHGTDGLIFKTNLTKAIIRPYAPDNVSKWLKKYISPKASNHWLRRTVATCIADMEGISEFDVKIILNHAVSGQTSKYVHTQYMDRKRAIYSRWHSHIDSLISMKLAGNG